MELDTSWVCSICHCNMLTANLRRYQCENCNDGKYICAQCVPDEELCHLDESHLLTDMDGGEYEICPQCKSTSHLCHEIAKLNRVELMWVCDVCKGRHSEWPASPGHHCCDACNEGDYDICAWCVAEGHWCLDTSHTLRTIAGIATWSSSASNAWSREKTLLRSALDGHPPFRLLRLHPSLGTRTDAEQLFGLLACDLGQVDPENIPSYNIVIAEPRRVDERSDHKIVCNGAALTVTRRTCHTLLKLRRLGHQYIWFEALCVDDDERITTDFRKIIRHKATGVVKLSDLDDFALLRLEPRMRYKYSPLHQDDEIRLLSIAPSVTEDPILNISMEVVSLASRPKFARANLDIAPFGPDTTVWCNGQLFSTPWSVVNTLASRGTPRGPRLFVETICVRLDDAMERIHHNVLRDQLEGQAKAPRLSLDGGDHTYRALDTPRETMRLLRLIPGYSGDDSFQTELVNTSLEDAPKFAALSYCWGSPDRTIPLLVDDASMYITRNLNEALGELWLHGHEYVWADAICINQNDNTERSAQVMMMTKIYISASEVVVIPGSRCMDPSHLSHRFGVYLMKRLALTSAVLQATRPTHPTLEFGEVTKFRLPNQADSVSWEMWQSMRSQPWYSRAWIVQEVSVNSNVWMIYNGTRVNFRHVIAANLVVDSETTNLGDRNVWTGRRNLVAIAQLKQILEKGLLLLLDLLCRFRDFQSTEPKDKIYAFHGLAADYDSLPRIDYSQSAEETFMRFARYFVESGQGLIMISAAGIDRATLQLPSWVPDWSYRDEFRHTFPGIKSGTVRLQPFAAAKGLLGSVRLDRTGDLVIMEGIRFDIVKGATPSISLEGQMPGYLLETLEEAANLLIRPTSGIYLDSQEAFLRTIVSDQGSTRTQKHYSYEELFVFYSAMLNRHQYARDHIGLPDDENLNDETEEYISQCYAVIEGRSLAITEHGYMAILPGCARKDDEIYIVPGLEVPYVLRKEGDSYLLIGDSYVHGVMHGEGLKDAKVVEISLI